MKIIKIADCCYNANTLINFWCKNDAMYLNLRNFFAGWSNAKNYCICLVGNSEENLNAIFKRFVDFLSNDKDGIFVFNCEGFEGFTMIPSGISSCLGYNKEEMKKYEEEKERMNALKRTYTCSYNDLHVLTDYLCKIINIEIK
ncbi:MAG: hypothetical protein IK117_08830 [Bacteroidales bacterium]|nr:hypothetical protein [Bacteroidales bacterium]